MKKFHLYGSMKCAIRGIIYCINNERNMRIHIIAMISVILFSLFFNLSTVEYAVLMITIAMVISAEMVNTALEELVDMSTISYSPMARIAKDVAAGAVLILAVFAVAVAVFIFWKPDGFYNIYNFILLYPYLLLIVALFVALAVLFIICGPIGLKEIFTKFKNKKLM